MNERELLTALRESREIIAEQSEILDRLSTAASIPAIVANVSKTHIMVNTANQTFVVMVPPRIKLKPGQTVLLDPTSNQIKSAFNNVLLGPIGVVQTILSDNKIEVEINGTNKVVQNGDLQDIKEGDQIMLDPSGYIAMSFIKRDIPKFAPVTVPDVTWDDIGGQIEAKKELIEAIEFPRLYPELIKAYGKRPIKGVMLSGPPGCGKTMLGKACAKSLSKDASFLYVKATEILDPYVGVAETTIRNLFRQAAEYKKNTGHPAVIFIDEADAILGVRGSRQSHMEKTIVPAFLVEMDGLDDSNALVILSTNRPDSLDPAIIRDGRIDRKVQVKRPGQNDVSDILNLYLKKVPIVKGENRTEMAEKAAASIFNKENIIYHIETLSSLKPAYLSDTVSGSMVAGIVDKAVSIAFHRDLENKIKKPTGVTSLDIKQAISHALDKAREIINHDVVREVSGGEEIQSIRRYSNVSA